MKHFELAVVIGRFQPFHNGHHQLVLHALRVARRVLILVGSSQESRTEKNPFNFEERHAMILSNFSTLDRGVIHVRALPDSAPDNAAWVADVKCFARTMQPDDRKTTLVGCDRDESTFYLHMFKEWLYTGATESLGTCGTTVRKMLGSQLYGSEDIRGLVPNGTFQTLSEIRNGKF